MIKYKIGDRVVFGVNRRGKFKTAIVWSVNNEDNTVVIMDANDTGKTYIVNPNTLDQESYILEAKLIKLGFNDELC